MQLDHLAGGSFHPKGIKGRTIRKVMGGGGGGEKTKKKFMQGEMTRKNIHAKKKIKKKIHAEGKSIVTFSESLSFFQKD